MDIPFIANHLTMQNIINCYVKETGEGDWKHVEEVSIPIEDQSIKQVLVISFKRQSVTLYIPVRYQSVTERHLFAPRMFYQIKNDEMIQLDYMTLMAFMQKEFVLANNQSVQADELMLRTILSYQNIKRIISHRSSDLDECYQIEKTFLQSEQSLLIGHQVHPTPKSRQGIDEDEEHIFSPETKGAFQLHYFQAVQDIVDEDSALPQSASLLIKEELKKDPFVTQAFKDQYCQEDHFSLIPIHPLQARKLLGREDVCVLIELGKLTYLGPQGREFYPTSSVRTVYHPEAGYMYKFSIPVRITNSLRINKRKELSRGVEVSRLLQSEVSEKLNEYHPSFRVMEDPAYMTLKLAVEETGFEVVIRENPFQDGKESRTTLLAALCQDHITGEASHLANIINQLANDEKISVAQASEQWFAEYLKVSLRPMYWLYHTYGIALEAHQQNSIIQLDEQGYPELFYYRDNQGYYFTESKAEVLKQIVSTLNEKSDTICSDLIAEERFRYYVFFNHLFGLVNAFGVNRLINERRLLSMIKEELLDLNKLFGDDTNLLTSLLHEEKLPCKGNLLTRVYDMDELEGSLETQSIYVHVSNPLAVLAGERHGI